MGRAADADARIRHHINHWHFTQSKAMSRIVAEIEFVMPILDIERLRQFPGTRTKITDIICPAALFHQFNTAARFDCANQDQSIARPAFDQHVQHPMHPVVKINVSRARLVALYELARTRPAEGVGSLVLLGEIRFGFYNYSLAPPPHQRRPDEV